MMRVGDDEDEDDDTAALPPWLPRYEKLEKIPRIFVASVVVSKYLDDGCYRLKTEWRIKNQLLYCPA